MKQTALMLYGSLTVGLAVTLFGTFEPNIQSALSPDWFVLGIAFNGDCGRFENPILTEYGNYYKVEQWGISCNDGSTVYQFKTLDPDSERIDWDITSVSDSAVIDGMEGVSNGRTD